MGTIIKFPTPPWQDIDINYHGLELFVASCCKLLDTLPVETRHPAKQEFDRLVEGLLQFMDECHEARSRK
jgi:hypothetical protein